MWKTRHSFKHVTEDEGFAVGVTEEWQETKLSEGGKGDGRDVDADRLRGGENSPKVIIYNVYNGKVRVSGDNRVEEGIDGGKGGCVGPYFIVYIYFVSVPLLFHYSLTIGGGLGWVDDRKEALEGYQKLDELLFVRKRPLLAMRPTGGGGEEQRLPYPVEV